jgi:hypothetical protein
MKTEYVRFIASGFYFDPCTVADRYDSERLR